MANLSIRTKILSIGLIGIIGALILGGFNIWALNNSNAAAEEIGTIITAEEHQVGGFGNIIAGVWKGFCDLKEAGIVDRTPKMLCAQSEESAAISQAVWKLQKTGRSPSDWKHVAIAPVSATTLADSISVDIPRDGLAAVRAVVEEVFPPCERGEREEPGCYLPHSGFHVTRFRRRFFALVYDPVVVVFRAPDLLGLYLPSELIGGVEELAAPFERFVRLLSSSLEEGPGHTPPVRVEMAYDSRLSWAREGGVLRGPSFESLVGDYPFLGPTIEWLRGG